MQLLLPHPVLCQPTLHLLGLVSQVVLTASDLGLVLLLLLVELLALIEEHLKSGLLASSQFCEFVALGLDYHLLHGKCLLGLALGVAVLIVELLVLAVVADADELVGILHLALLPDVLQAY